METSKLMLLSTLHYMPLICSKMIYYELFFLCWQIGFKSACSFDFIVIKAREIACCFLLQTITDVRVWICQISIKGTEQET